MCKINQWPHRVIEDTTNNQDIVEILAIGKQKEDVSISVQDDMLIISSEGGEEEEYETLFDGLLDGDFIISYGCADTDVEKVTAVLKDGILSVTCPYKEEYKVKTVKIEVQ